MFGGRYLYTLNSTRAGIAAAEFERFIDSFAWDDWGITVTRQPDCISDLITYDVFTDVIDLRGYITGKSKQLSICFRTLPNDQVEMSVEEHNPNMPSELTDRQLQEFVQSFPEKFIDYFQALVSESAKDSDIKEEIEHKGIYEDAQIFLGYAREDEEKVEQLYQKLSDAGFKPWMDKKDILPGERWESCIPKAIRHSDFFLACLSANSVNKRGYLQKEIKDALDTWQKMLEDDIYLIPVRLEDCKVPESLRKFHWVELFEEDGWTRLVEAIQVGIERRKE
jgi:hypothetical protein